MKKVLKSLVIHLLLFISLSHSTLSGENQYPIVLVHGFIGWGPEEMRGHPYWGGDLDIAGYLESLGFEVFTVSVGPVSSNWERSVEMFYQLKGGQIDYGKNHADKWGVIQKPIGKFYEGLYPEWDQNHPVHFIGHSMGGQTIRMLAHQLSHIFYTDSTQEKIEESPLLGMEHNEWVKSITTFSTPHNGTTLSDLVNKSVPFLQNFIILGAVVESGFYDFDLQHWGFSRGDNESWIKYFKRMRNHSAWNTKNICAWDLSVDGAQELNSFLISQPDMFYFSFMTSSTHKDEKSGYHEPDKNISLMLRIKSRILGSKMVRFQDGTVTDSSWYENDGVVNTISQKGPTTGRNGPDPLAIYNPEESLIPGQWYVMGKLKLDHWKIVGQGRLDDKEKEFLLSLYKKHSSMLWELPD
jgi:triacylglycerol lipase